MTDPVRRGIPFGAGLRGHTDAVLWGSWGLVGGEMRLATGSRDDTVRLWDPAGGRQVGEPTVAKSVWGAWARDRAELAIAGRGAGIQVWTPGAAEGPLVVCDDDPIRDAVDAGWVTLAGRPALLSVDAGGVTLWDRNSGPDSRRRVNHGQVGIVWGAWSETGGRVIVATGGTDRRVRFWELRPEGPRSLGDFTPSTVGTWGAWTTLGDDPVLATPGEMYSVHFWNPLRTHQILRSLSGHAGPVTWGGWGEVDGEPRLATGSGDRTVRIWDPASGAQVGPSLVGHLSRVNWGAWAVVGDTSVLATGDDTGMVRLWDPGAGVALGDPLETGKPSRWGTWAVVGGKPILATGGDDNVVRLWEVVDERPIGANLPHYRSDEQSSPDLLERKAEATAVAGLLTARSAYPPMAIGLFGDWGEGKSHFMTLLHQQVTAAKTHRELSHQHVRQVRFNAWHYAETDLWASLVAELFTQLAGPDSGEGPIDQRQQSRLTHELIERRGLRRRLDAARARRDALLAAVDHPAELWRKLPQDQRERIEKLTDGKAQRLYEDVVRTARTLRWPLIARVLGLVALGVVVIVTVRWLPTFTKWTPVAGALALIDFVFHGGRRLKRHGDKAWKAATECFAAQRQRLAAAAESVGAEVAELERQVGDFTAAGQLAGVVADRAASNDYRSRLDVMSRIREDFSRMSDLLAKADGDPEPDPDEVGDELPRIDRIVIYVDDLDRCPAPRVVEMLEAVHLLLAAKLFVVVVAVDPTWLLGAIRSHYPDLENPTQYLEKIFQVVLTLPSLDTAGYQRMLRQIVGTRADEDPAPLPGPASVTVATVRSVQLSPKAPPSGGASPGVSLPRPRGVDRVDLFALHPDEIRLLDLVGPPHLIATPRQAKRLANSYGLLTALREPFRSADLDERSGYYPYRAGLVLLAALVAQPADGASFLKDLKAAGGSWTDFLTGRADNELASSLLEITKTAAGHDLALPEPLCAWSEWIVPVGRLSFPAGSVR